MKNNLREAVTVAQVDKNQAAVIAAVLHPTHQANIFTIIGNGQLSAGMAALPVTKLSDKFLVFALHILLRVLRLHLFSHCWFPFAKIGVRPTAAQSIARRFQGFLRPPCPERLRQGQ